MILFYLLQSLFTFDYILEAILLLMLSKTPSKFSLLLLLLYFI